MLVVKEQRAWWFQSRMAGFLMLLLMPLGCGEAGSPINRANDGVTCLEDEKVEDGECVVCADGSTNDAGDDPLGEDTSCDSAPDPAPDTQEERCLDLGGRWDRVQEDCNVPRPDDQPSFWEDFENRFVTDFVANVTGLVVSPFIRVHVNVVEGVEYRCDGFLVDAGYVNDGVEMPSTDCRFEVISLEDCEDSQRNIDFRIEGRGVADGASYVISQWETIHRLVVDDPGCAGLP